MTKDTFEVPAIHCQGCERTIRMLLTEVDGVEQVDADYRAGTVAVTFDEQRVTRDDVARELAGIGYAPRE